MSPMNPIHRKSLPGPHDITRVELPNGIVVITRSNFNSQSTILSGYLQSGSIFDPMEKLGLAQYTASMLMRGTTTNTFQQIYNTMESAGASLGYGASVHNTAFGGRSLAEDLPMILDLLSQTLRNPVFPADHMEKQRAQFMTMLAIRAQDTEEMSSLTFDQILFKNHPYGRPEEGYQETIQNIQRSDLEDFHRKHYGPRGMVIAIVGAITPKDAVELVEKHLGDWQNPDQVKYPEKIEIQPLTKVERQHIEIPGKSQVDLVMGTYGPRRNNPDYLAASLGNSILGQFGMMGRIGDVVREQAGLAYNASTSLNAWIESGSWEISAGVNPANLQRAIDLIISELDRFIQHGVTDEELADSQANFIGRLPLSLESNNGVSGALLNLERFGLGLDYFQLYPDMVENITPEMVLQAARNYIDPTRMAIVSAGTTS